MKNHLLILVAILLFPLSVSAQKSKDAIYLKNGSIIYGKLIEIVEDQYKLQTSDGSIFIYKSSEVEKFSKDSPSQIDRRTDGFGFALEAGLLAGAQHTEYTAPFSFNFLGGYIINARNILSVGSGVEFIGKSFTPLFAEYKYLFFDRKTSPFIFFRGGGLLQIGSNDTQSSDPYYNYDPFNYKGGASFGFGTGVSWAREDYETYLSFAYRYAHTSYQKQDYNQGIVTYNNYLNRLEVKFGFRF